MEKNGIDKISVNLEEELNELAEIRKRNAERHSLLSEEDLVNVLAAEYEDVFRDAVENGVNFEIISEEDLDN